MAIVLGSFRKGEVVNLRWQDIILEARWAFVLDYEGDDLTEAWSPKTESSRRAVPLHPLLARTLAGLERVRGPDGTVSPWVFPVTDARRKERLVDRRGRVHPVRGDRRSADTTWFGRCLRLANERSARGERRGGKAGAMIGGAHATVTAATGATTTAVGMRAVTRNAVVSLLSPGTMRGWASTPAVTTPMSRSMDRIRAWHSRMSMTSPCRASSTIWRPSRPPATRSAVWQSRMTPSGCSPARI
jgi:hypothetical protein